MDIPSFIQAIIDNPHDDDARLVFADYLEEIGDPRAEMIRLQFQLAETSRHAPLRRKLRARELELLRLHNTFGHIPDVAKFLEWRGGFIDAIEITVARFLKHQEEIFSGSPIRKVVFTGRSKKIDKLAESPFLSRLTSITLKNNDDSDQNLIKLLSSDKLIHLEELDLRGHWVTPKSVETIASSATLSKLTSLGIHGYDSLRSLQQLADSPYITKLQSIRLSGVTNDTCSMIAAASNFCHLREIEVQGRGLTTDGMRTLQTSEIYPELETLRMNDGSYGYYSDEEQSKPSPFQIESRVGKLKQLELIGGFSGEIVPGILNNYADLEVLRLSENHINDMGAIALAQSDLFGNLHKLYLTNNNISAVGLTALGRAKEQNRSVKLYLDGNRINQSEAAKLRKQFGRTFISRNHTPWFFAR